MSDVVVAAFVAGIFGGVIGTLGSAFFAWRQDVGRARRADAAEQAARIREVWLATLEATRRYMVDQLDFAEAFVVFRDRSAVGPTRADGRRANIGLVGDFDVAKAYSDRLIRLMEGAPIGLRDAVAGYWRPRTLAEIEPDQLAETARIRAELLAALDRQELRLHRGEEPLELSEHQVAALPGPQAFVEMLRRRTRRH